MTDKNLNLTFGTMVDGAIKHIEACGVRWYVMAGTEAIPAFLAFELSSEKGLTGGAVMWMDFLRRQFAASAELRKEMIDFALSVGSLYVEIGNAHPVINEGRTTQ